MAEQVRGAIRVRVERSPRYGGVTAHEAGAGRGHHDLYSFNQG